MSAHARPIRHTLMTVILLTCGAVMLITSAAFVAYEYVTFRQLMVRNIEILGEAIAANSTAALAFDNPDDAREVLAAFRAQPHVVAARLDGAIAARGWVPIRGGPPHRRSAGRAGRAADGHPVSGVRSG